MNKILMGLLTIALVSFVAVGATQAYFSDTETSTGNSFTAGTLDLKLDAGDINVIKFAAADFNNLKPGDTGTGTWTVYNSGSINGYLDIQPIALVDDDNGCNEPEGLVDSLCGAGQGDLSANMNVDLFVDANHNSVFDAGDTTIYTGLLSGINSAGYDANIALNASATNYITLNWGIPTATGNIIQSDSTILGMTFELGQTAGQ